jgi:hypothetical protein
MLVVFRGISEASSIFWLLSDIGYWTPALFTYLVMGVPIFLLTYRYTREIRPLILAGALIIVSLGFIIAAFNDIYDFLPVPTPEFIGNLSALGNILPFLGLTAFTIVYLTNINYLYRLPNDVFLLMVVTRAGIPLHSVRLRTRAKVAIETDLLSGMISAINSVFSEVFKTQTTIRNISSEGLYILMEPGEKEQIMALVITDKVSFFLDKALKRYAKTFEQEFAVQLKNYVQDTAVYQTAITLIKPIFPFFIIDEENTDHSAENFAL